MLNKLTVAANDYLRLKGSLDHHHTERRRSSILSHDDEHHPRMYNQDFNRRFSASSDSSERHRAMVELQEHLGRPGTSAHDIERLMGTPTKILDQPDQALLSELKRNNENYEYPHDTKIWIYDWSRNRDFIHFLISKDKKVIQSAWYYSFE